MGKKQEKKAIETIFKKKLPDGQSMEINRADLLGHANIYEFVVSNEDEIRSDVILDEKEFRSLYDSISKFFSKNPIVFKHEFDNMLVFAGNTIKITFKGIYRKGDKIKLIFVCENSTTPKNITISKLLVDGQFIENKYGISIKKEGRTEYPIEIEKQFLSDVTDLKVRIKIKTNKNCK